jgi:hypothetical protein
MSNSCPNVVVTPGTPGTAPATWGNPITLSTADLVGFGVLSAGSKVSLKCSDGRTLLDALAVVSWSAQAIVCTLPPKNAVAACDVPLYYELWVSLSPLNQCGPYIIDIVGVIDPTQPASIDPKDLTELATGFTISVTIPGPGPIETGVPVRIQLVPPLGTGLSFTGVDGRPLPLPRKWKPPVGPIRLQSMEIAASSKTGQTPPLVVRSEATYAALAKRFAAREHVATPGSRTAGDVTRVAARLSPEVGGPPTAVLPPPLPSITVEVSWSVTAFSLFGVITVDEGTLFVLANPDDPVNGVVPTLTSVLLGVLSRPWITAMTDPPTPPRQVAAYFINARIRLSAGATVVGDWINLQPVQLPIPTLPIPVILLLFRDTGYTGRVLPCVPANSLYNKLGPLRTALDGVRAALAPLAALASVATWLLGLDKLLSLLPVDDNSTVAVAGIDGKINLDDYELDHSISSIWPFGGWDWEDQVSSILVFGPPSGTTISAGAGPTGSSVAFFSAPDWSDSEGQYNIDIGFELSVLVPSLASKYPASFPAGALTVIKDTTDDNFNDVLSTLMFI